MNKSLHDPYNEDKMKEIMNKHEKVYLYEINNKLWWLLFIILLSILLGSIISSVNNAMQLATSSTMPYIP